MVPGAITAEIGSEAVQDALNRGWVRPDAETGFLCLTDQHSQLIEMRELAGHPEPADKKVKETVESASRSFVMNHSVRNVTEAFGVGLASGTSGIGAPGSGQTRGVAPALTPTSPQANKPGQDYIVGEDVMIADEGKSYQAKVQSKNPDGTYKLSFGPNRPTKQDRMFRREEMQRIQAEREGTVKVQQ
jgi:hypothetical protein